MKEDIKRIDYTALKPTDWLPTSVKEMKALGWSGVDVVLFSGDAYVDHPSFGAAVIGRTLQAAGYSEFRVCFSVYLPERWTLWSTIIQPTAVVAATMHILLAVDTA